MHVQNDVTVAYLDGLLRSLKQVCHVASMVKHGADCESRDV